MAKFIYLHGFTSGPQSFKAAAFKKQFEQKNLALMVPDLEGGDFENLTVSKQVRIAQGCMEGQPGDRFGLIGSSMGGYLAVLLAQLRQDVAALYLMAPGFNFLQRWMCRLAGDDQETFKIPGLIKVFHYRYNEERALNTRIFEDAKQWERVSFSRVLPVRLVHGRHDEAVDIEVSRKFAQEHPHCRFQELDSDHGLISHIDWIVKDCLDFFQEEGLL